MNDINYEELQARVEKGIKRQKLMMRWLFLGVNILFYFIFVIMLLITQASNSEIINSLPEHVSDIFVLPLVMWPVGIILQFIVALMESGVMDKQIASKVVGQELGNQILESRLQGMTEKAKRHNLEAEDEEAMTISDDGELIPLQNDEERPYNARR